MAKGGSWATCVRLCFAALVVTVIAWPACALDGESVAPNERAAVSPLAVSSPLSAQAFAQPAAAVAEEPETAHAPAASRSFYLRTAINGLILATCLALTVFGNAWSLPACALGMGILFFSTTRSWLPAAVMIVTVAVYLAAMKWTIRKVVRPPSAKRFALAMPGLAFGSFVLLVVLRVLGNLAASGTFRFLPIVTNSAGMSLVLLVLGLVGAAVHFVARVARERPSTPWRFRWFKVVTLALWALFTTWSAVQINDSMRQIATLQERAADFDPSVSPYRRQQPEASREAAARQAAAAARPSLDNLAINLWGLLGAVILAFLGINPFRWIGAKRLLWGSVALGLCVGSLSLGPLLYHLGPFLPFTLPLVADDILRWVVFPVTMLLGSLLVFNFLFGTTALVIGLFIGMPIFFFNQILQLDNMLHIYRYQRTGLATYIARFAYWLMGQPRRTPLPDESRGARFAIPEEAAAVRMPDGMAFGHVEGAPFFLHTEKHVLIMGGTRSGKGVSLIVPHLLRYPGSAFVLDPKGENAKATGRQRAALNDAVHVLDPFGISGMPRARFNPLARFTPENMEAESKALAAALVLMPDARDHWTAAAQQLLAAIILHVVTADNIPPESKDLPTVRRLLLGAVNDVLRDMAASPAAGGLVGDLAASFLNTPEKEFGSIVSTAQRETEILDNPFIIASLAASGPDEEVDFTAWRSGTMTVYLCLSAPKFPTFNRWLRLVLTAALDEMTDTLAPPPLPVCFMLDELATLGHLQPVENAVGLAAGYGIQLVTVFQDVAQMRDLYKGRWASFIGNAGVRALFALDDYDTAAYWSKFIGSHIVATTSRQQDIYGLTSSRNVGETVRPLLSPEQIMLRYAAGPGGTGGMLVLPEGSHPVESEKVPYFADSRLEGLWDDPRAPAAPPEADHPELLPAT